MKNNKLGALLKRIRLEAFGLSLEKFTIASVGVSKTHWQRYESNNFGKKFERNKTIKIKEIAKEITHICYEFNQDNNYIDIDINKIKEILIDSIEKDKENLINEMRLCEIKTKDGMENFIYRCMLYFIDESDKFFVETSNLMDSERKKSEFERNMRDKRISLGISTCEDDDYVMDYMHIYELIKRYDYHEFETGDYYSYRWITVTNDTNKDTNFLIHKEYGENKIKFKDMMFVAKECKKDMLLDLKIENISGNMPSFSQTIKIYFDKPLRPKQTKKVFFRLKWPNEIEHNSLRMMNTSISTLRYKKGVKKLIFGVINKYDIIEKICHRIDYNFENIDSISKYKNINVYDNDFIELRDRGMYGICYEINEPLSLCYWIHFNKPYEKNINTTEELK